MSDQDVGASNLGVIRENLIKRRIEGGHHIFESEVDERTDTDIDNASDVEQHDDNARMMIMMIR